MVSVGELKEPETQKQKQLVAVGAGGDGVSERGLYSQ
jgi:hypothetical protein